MATQHQLDNALGMGPAAFHGVLVSGLAQGRGAVVTTGMLECEARRALKAGDLDRSGVIRMFLDRVYECEANAVEAVVDGQIIPGISAKGAEFFLGRGRAVAKLATANGGNEFQALANHQFWKATVAFKELILALAIATDPGPGEFPGTMEAARAIVDSQLKLAWPGYCAGLGLYVKLFDKDGHDEETWRKAKKAHKMSVKEWLTTTEDRLFISGCLRTTLDEAVEAAKAYCPAVFTSGNDGHDFTAAYCPAVLHLVDVMPEEVLV